MAALQHVGAAAPGPVTPISDEAPALAGAEGFKEQAQGVSLDSAARERVEQADKAFNTLRARLALAGHSLHILDDGEGGTAYLVHAWNLHRELPDLAALEVFTKLVEGRA